MGRVQHLLLLNDADGISIPEPWQGAGIPVIGLVQECITSLKQEFSLLLCLSFLNMQSLGLFVIQAQ